MSSVAPPYRGVTVSFARRIVVPAESAPQCVFSARMQPDPGGEELIRAPRTPAWSTQGAPWIFHAAHLSRLLASYNIRCGS